MYLCCCNCCFRDGEDCFSLVPTTTILFVGTAGSPFISLLTTSHFMYAVHFSQTGTVSLKCSQKPKTINQINKSKRYLKLAFSNNIIIILCICTVHEF